MIANSSEAQPVVTVKHYRVKLTQRDIPGEEYPVKAVYIEQCQSREWTAICDAISMHSLALKELVIVGCYLERELGLSISRLTSLDSLKIGSCRYIQLTVGSLIVALIQS